MSFKPNSKPNAKLSKPSAKSLKMNSKNFRLKEKSSRMNLKLHGIENQKPIPKKTKNRIFQILTNNHMKLIKLMVNHNYKIKLR